GESSSDVPSGVTATIEAPLPLRNVVRQAVQTSARSRAGWRPPSRPHCGHAQSRSRIAISGPSSSEFAEEIQDPELPDSPDGLPDDPLGHLGLADVPVGEDDRDLDEAGPSLPGAHAHLDLE